MLSFWYYFPLFLTIWTSKLRVHLSLSPLLHVPVFSLHSCPLRQTIKGPGIPLSPPLLCQSTLHSQMLQYGPSSFLLLSFFPYLELNVSVYSPSVGLFPVFWALLLSVCGVCPPSISSSLTCHSWDSGSFVAQRSLKNVQHYSHMFLIWLAAVLQLK